VLRKDPDLWMCSLDAAQFEAMLLNLALNARDAMREGGRLVIETRRTERGANDPPNGDEWQPGKYVAISVADTGTGTGMAEHVRERAFEPFFTTKEVGEGSGLGLSQVYGSAKQLGGHVTIDSAAGRGTTITVYLPWAAAAPARKPAASASPQPAAAEAGETVLVVEDDADVRQSVVAPLASLGYRVLSAADGGEAIGILNETQRIDLLFTDVVMPQGISGVEVAKEAKRLHGDIKVLLTSGYTQDVIRAQGANGNFPLVAKPYRQHELADEVRRIMKSGAD
jgi:CheY-like chemotaxis protein